MAALPPAGQKESQGLVTPKEKGVQRRGREPWGCCTRALDRIQRVKRGCLSEARAGIPQVAMCSVKGTAEKGAPLKRAESPTQSFRPGSPEAWDLDVRARGRTGLS